MTLFPWMISRTWTAGSESFPARLIPPGLTWCKILLDVTAMTNPSNRLTLIPEISLDAGTTWKGLLTATFEGGLPGPRAGPPPLVSNLEVLLTDPHNPDSARDASSARRMIRATAIVEGPPVTLSVSVEVR